MNKKIGGIKFTQLTTGIIFLIAGIFFLVMVLLISARIKQPILFGIAIPIFLILFIEGSLYWISESIKIDEEKLKMKTGNIFAQTSHAFALYSKYTSLIKTIFIFLLMLSICGFIGYNILKSTEIKNIFYSISFYIQLGVYLLYFLIIRPLVKKAIGKSGNPIKNFNKQNIPDYSLEGDGLTLNLRYSGGRASIFAIIGFISGIVAFILALIGQKQAALIFMGIFLLMVIFIIIFKGKATVRPVRLGFNEIDEIRAFSPVEARSLVEYEIGPDINLQMQSTGDTIKFLRGEIERPSTYILPISSAEKILLIQGPELFYFVPVSNEDTEELIGVFKKFKTDKRR